MKKTNILCVYFEQIKISLTDIISMCDCPRCGKKFSFSSELARHMKRKFPCKNSESSDAFECSECLKTYANKGSLKRHQNDGYCTGKQESADEEVTSEEQDSESTSTEEEYDTHKCTLCNKTFTFKHNLKRHQASRCIVKKDAVVQKVKERNDIIKDIKYIRTRLEADIVLLKDLQSKLEHTN